MVKFRLAYHISILFQVGCPLWSEPVTRREEEDGQREKKKKNWGGVQSAYFPAFSAALCTKRNQEPFE